jgi:hypothetical protein
MLLRNILREPLNWLSINLGDSTNLREVLTPFAAFLGGPLTQNKEKLENHILSCQTFSEILRIFEKVWYEAHQYLKYYYSKYLFPLFTLLYRIAMSIDL